MKVELDEQDYLVSNEFYARLPEFVGMNLDRPLTEDELKLLLSRLEWWEKAKLLENARADEPIRTTIYQQIEGLKPKSRWCKKPKFPLVVKASRRLVFKARPCNRYSCDFCGPQRRYKHLSYLCEHVASTEIYVGRIAKKQKESVGKAFRRIGQVPRFTYSLTDDGLWIISAKPAKGRSWALVQLSFAELVDAFARFDLAIIKKMTSAVWSLPKEIREDHEKPLLYVHDVGEEFSTPLRILGLHHGDEVSDEQLERLRSLLNPQIMKVMSQR